MLECTYSRSLTLLVLKVVMLCFVCSAQCCVCTCFSAVHGVAAYRKDRGLRLVGEGCCGHVSVFQAHTQQNHLLSRGTIRSPVALHGCWTCFLPFSLPSLCSPPPFATFLPLYKHKSLPLFCRDMSAEAALKVENVLEGMTEASGHPWRNDSQ